MFKDKLAEIIREHKKWLANNGGNRADLSYADLSYADLSYADLRHANLSYADLRHADLSYANANLSYLSYANLSYADLSHADLRHANLSYADLSYADLRRADLSYANLSYADLSYANLKDTFLENINWLAYIGIVPNKQGIAYAYKITDVEGEGIFNGGINYSKKINFEVGEVDSDVNKQCSYGINLATFGWCLNQFIVKTCRLFMFKFNIRDAVCPIGSDGKFRVKKCQKIGECDWKGNLLPVQVGKN